MHAVKIDEAGAVLGKLSALFGGERVDWIEIDFSAWNPNDPSGSIFNILKQGILGQRVIELNYSGADGKTTRREVEPLKLMFRERSWYLLAWCRLRQDFRYFKLSRIGKPVLLSETFERHEPPTLTSNQPYKMPAVEITARITSALSYRVLDELNRDKIQKCEDGSFLVRFSLPENEWLYQYLMTYGADLYVIEPLYVREALYKKLKTACAQYEI